MLIFKRKIRYFNLACKIALSNLCGLCLPSPQQIQNFGDPFFLVLHEDETLAEVKGRIQKKLQVPDEEFSKV